MVAFHPAFTVALLALAGCGDKDGEPAEPIEDTAAGAAAGDSDPPVDPDADGDGYPGDADCDDADPGINPGASEVCDGADNDCDGDADEDAVDAPAWYVDADGDGFGDASASVVACAAPAGEAPAWVTDPWDCDDSAAAVHPGAVEVCLTAADDDCDGAADEPDAVGAMTWYADADGDGFGDPAIPKLGCAGAAWASNDKDCDDADSGAYPDAVEWCDGVDSDCDGTDDDADAEDRVRWYEDADGDGYGGGYSHYGCDHRPGTASVEGDCDDNDASLSPIDEICTCDDGDDNDGDGLTDCEDGDCAAEAGCGEECRDEADNDGDGLVDCGDDECWGTAACVESVAWVNSGAFSGGVRDWYRHSPAGGAGEDGASGFTFWNSAWSVQGSVRLRSSALALSTTCTWSLTHAAWSQGRSYGWENWFGVIEEDRWSEFYAPVARAGAALSPACPLALDVEALIPSYVGAAVDTAWLPWGYVGYPGPWGTVYAISARWYVPGAWSSAARVVSTYTPGSSPGWGWKSSYQTTWSGSLTTGDGYEAGAWPPW